MRPNSILSAAAVGALALFAASSAQAQNVLSPSDFIIAIDGNRNNPGNSNTGAEGPTAAFDENAGGNTKWFTAAREFSGVIITPSGGPATVQSLQFTTANDSANRDPVTYRLYGTNNSISTAANGTGLEDSWTFIGTGNTGIATSDLPATARNTTVAPVDVANNTAYSSYKVVFPALRLGGDAANAPSNPNGMQVNEIRMFNAPAGGGTNVGLNPTLVVPIDQTDSAHPPAEGPKGAIDGNTATKYLNFGREGSGLIIKPTAGPTTVGSLQITTANDSPNRDPASFELYGHNGAILSIDNSEGTDEAWTLIASGALNLPGDPAINGDQRLVDGPVVAFSNNTAYDAYKIVFPTTKAAGANSIQFSELKLFNVPEPSSAAVIALGAVALLKRRRRQA